MDFKRTFLVSTLVLCTLASSRSAAQNQAANDDSQHSLECTAELFDGAENAYRSRIWNPYRAEKKLEQLHRACRNASLIPEITRRLSSLREARANHIFLIANYYYQRFKEHGAGLKGAQSRFRQIVDSFKEYSGMDKTLFLLADTYLLENNFAAAKQYLKRLIDSHPESEYANLARYKIKILPVEPQMKILR